ncbi:hypothetical protein GLOTRDRAFT_111538 [Gloeophyllum trabeum ATCC 11539]|uniref:Uncharacterized protein n=1 Tax=Gloeophyllum trabeum (strain ATCC 11539 / FP-39264 / Madison 617) TaxID=670483 RepID=S7RMZ9_GLOTA|nr:uncharacterized protein GLOTRDRAFT_111538 [Gloeophyllum trabeum ATCC 11539]EPQ54089.1 hypothetical protein GLOTRDRAFT_111538 [Gloeophyllum trabeum ATCC 11539]
MCSPDTWIQVLKNGTKPRVIAIKDRTLSAGRDAAMVPRLESSSHTPDRPVASLAIIYLPSSITGDSIAEHTYYLPVLVPPSCIINSFSEEIERHAARHRWEMLDIPESKVLTLTRTQKQEIIDANQVDSLDADDVCSAFEALFAESESRSVQGHAPLKDLGTRVNVLTVLTLLLSVLLTYTLKDVRASFPPASVVSLNGSRTIDSPNRSVSVPQPVAVPLADNNSGKAMISSSMKDLALAIFDTGSGSGSSSPVPSGSKRMPAAERGARTGRHTCSRPSAPLAKLPAAELILRPDYSVPALNNAASAAVSKALSVITPAHSTLKGKGKAKDDGREDVTALSLRVMGSLSEWFDVQTILNGVRRDVSDLVNALEDLMHMLGGIVEQGRKSLLTFVASLERPTGEAPEQYEAPVPDGRGLREALTERHSRAKQRAKEIKEAGSRWMADVKHRAEDCAKERVVALGGPVSGHIERPKRACDRKGDLRELSRGILDYVL